MVSRRAGSKTQKRAAPILPRTTLQNLSIGWFKLIHLDCESKWIPSRLTWTTTFGEMIKKPDNEYLCFTYNETKPRKRLHKCKKWNCEGCFEACARNSGEKCTGAVLPGTNHFANLCKEWHYPGRQTKHSHTRMRDILRGAILIEEPRKRAEAGLIAGRVKNIETNWLSNAEIRLKYEMEHE